MGRLDAAGIRVLPERMLQAVSVLFDETDFSVVVTNRAPPPKPWRWEIARRKSTIKVFIGPL
jgi:hypothetical protein